MDDTRPVANLLSSTKKIFKCEKRERQAQKAVCDVKSEHAIQPTKARINASNKTCGVQYMIHPPSMMLSPSSTSSAMHRVRNTNVNTNWFHCTQSMSLKGAASSNGWCGSRTWVNLGHALVDLSTHQTTEKIPNTAEACNGTRGGHYPILVSGLKSNWFRPPDSGPILQRISCPPAQSHEKTDCDVAETRPRWSYCADPVLTHGAVSSTLSPTVFQASISNRNIRLGYPMYYLSLNSKIPRLLHTEIP